MTIVLGWGWLGHKLKGGETWLLLKVLLVVILMSPIYGLVYKTSFLSPLIGAVETRDLVKSFLLQTVGVKILRSYIMQVQVAWVDSLQLANTKYTFLLVTVHTASVPFFVRFVQSLTPSVTFVVMQEIVLGLFEMMETNSLLNGRTLVESKLKDVKTFIWGVKQVRLSMSPKVSPESVESRAEGGTEEGTEGGEGEEAGEGGGGGGDPALEKRRILFGMIIITNAITEAMAITSAFAFRLAVDVDESVWSTKSGERAGLQDIHGHRQYFRT